MYRKEVLQAAWAAVQRHDGAPGVDGMSMDQIAATPESEAAFLDGSEPSLREKTDRAPAVRRVYLLKPNGKLRPLGIPGVRDRVVPAAVLWILEPSLEADFEGCSHGFRPGRSAPDALRVILEQLQAGKAAVYDGDLASDFDSIPHDKLLTWVRMRGVDGSVLGLIRQGLRAPVVERGQGGKPPTVRRNQQGTPQGGVLSPWLANSYWHWFDHLLMRAEGPGQWAQAQLVRYADDLVGVARYISPRLEGWIEDKLEGWLGLKINREKTRIIDLRQPDESLDFLGYRFRQERDLDGRPQRYWHLQPSPKAMAQERDAIRGLINPHQSHTPLPERIERGNRHRQGGANYFRLGHPWKAFHQLNHFVRYRLGQHLQRRSQRGWRAREGVSL